MLLRSTAPLALFVSFAILAGCSGGSATVGAANFSCSGTSVRALCLHNCNLGCSATGCLRTDIAQNEILVLQFTDDVDPSTVDSTTIRLRTASGAPPVGEFFVNGNQVEFVPTLLLSGGQTFFGFRPGETYSLTIPGGEDETNTVRSTSGYRFKEAFTCTLIASQGIQDLNGVPPSATLVSPSANLLTAAPLDTVIQLEFNEMVDVTPFLSGSPVTFDVRRTRPGPNGPECDSNSQPLTLPGTPRLSFDPARGISILTYTPQANLPSNVCVEINVTSAVVDLSGKPAQPQTFSFLTIVLPLVEQDITEDFDDDQFLDRDLSGGTWSGGIASFAKIGGDGRHGTFDPTVGNYLGSINGKHTYEINCDSTTIPAENTLTGSPIAITDGRFFFAKFVVPADHRLVFLGGSPPIVTVAGKIDVLGEIDVKGESVPYPPVASSPIGQTGGAGGVFGGAGGRGGDKCLGNGPSAAYQGRNGESARVIGGHGYATSTAGTGGQGSNIFPASGQNSALFFAPGIVTYTPSASAGGGGGGLLVPGQNGRVTWNNHNDPGTGVPPRLDVMGPPSPGGTAMQFFPFPPATGLTKSSLHFLVGGSGGGGAASNAALAISVARSWAAGAGAGGGGGAIALRAGDSLNVGAIGSIRANGGTAGSVSGTAGATAAPAPAGGGSGGSIVLQSGRLADLAGLLTVLGGAGGAYNRQSGGAPPNGAQVQIAGGNGSSGFVRFEMPGTPSTTQLTNMQPAPTAQNVAPLTETDDLTSFRSTWYSTNLVFGPEFARYEIHATVDGVPVVYSDDINVSTVQAGSGQALRFWIQAAQLDLTTGAVLEQRAWRTGVLTTGQAVGIASDGLNGFRFAITQDRTVGQVVTIDKVVIVYRV